MLFEGKAINLRKGDSFTFYENEPKLNEPGNYVSEQTHVNVNNDNLHIPPFRYKLKDSVEMFWLEIKFSLMTGC